MLGGGLVTWTDEAGDAAEEGAWVQPQTTTVTKLRTRSLTNRHEEAFTKEI